MERAVHVALIAAADAAGTEALLREAGYETALASDGIGALRLCGEIQPEIVVADAVLPGMDGYALAKRIRKLQIPRLPGIIVTCLPRMARECALPGVATLEKPFDAEMLAAAAARLSVEKRRPDGRMSTMISDMLDALGFAEGPGREYVADAAFLAGEDERLLSQLTSRLYPMVANRCGADANAVERAMRRATERAWSTGNIETQYRIFRNTIDAARGKPTCGEMIARLSEMLRREG